MASKRAQYGSGEKELQLLNEVRRVARNHSRSLDALYLEINLKRVSAHLADG